MKLLIRIAAAAALSASLVLAAENNLSGDTFTFSGEMSSRVTAYLTKRFKARGEAKGLTYTLHLPATSSEGFNSQLIDQVYRSFMPHPTKIEESEDEFGNQVLKLRWNKSIRVVQIDIQFSARIFSNFYPVVSESDRSQPAQEEMQIYLSSSQLSPESNYLINYVSRSVSYGTQRQVDAIKSIFLWIDENIELVTKAEASDALSVLQSGSGTEAGLCNLAAAMLKGLGIPVRVVYGVSFQKEIELNTDLELLYYIFPNGERFWVEVFVPDLGWVSYDPTGSHFATTSHLIKIAAGPDSGFAADSWEIEEGEVEFIQEFIYDVVEDESTLQYTALTDLEHARITISPPFDHQPASYQPGSEIETDQQTDVPAEPENVIGNGFTGQRLDVTATRDRIYAQRVVIEEPFLLDRITLPLIKFSDPGKIWIELYDNGPEPDTSGVPVKVLVETRRLASERVRFMQLEDPWLSFPLEQEFMLEPGMYWIALRSSGSCIFNWNGCGGNVVGDGRDTRFLDLGDKSRLWGHLVNIDLNFLLHSTGS
jgi:transglutaminase-like putative cysteine protease